MRLYGCRITEPGFPYRRVTTTFRIFKSRFRSLTRSRYIQRIRSSWTSSASWSVMSWWGLSTTISLAPRAEIRSNIPIPSRTRSSSRKK